MPSSAHRSHTALLCQPGGEEFWRDSVLTSWQMCSLLWQQPELRQVHDLGRGALGAAVGSPVRRSCLWMGLQSVGRRHKRSFCGQKFRRHAGSDGGHRTVRESGTTVLLQVRQRGFSLLYRGILSTFCTVTLGRYDGGERAVFLSSSSTTNSRTVFQTCDPRPAWWTTEIRQVAGAMQRYWAGWASEDIQPAFSLRISRPLSIVRRGWTRSSILAA